MLAIRGMIIAFLPFEQERRIWISSLSWLFLVAFMHCKGPTPRKCSSWDSVLLVCCLALLCPLCKYIIGAHFCALYGFVLNVVKLHLP